MCQEVLKHTNSQVFFKSVSDARAKTVQMERDTSAKTCWRHDAFKQHLSDKKGKQSLPQPPATPILTRPVCTRSVLNDEREVTRQICVFYTAAVVVFFKVTKGLHNSTLMLLRANKSDRRHFGGGSKDPRG